MSEKGKCRCADCGELFRLDEGREVNEMFLCHRHADMFEETKREDMKIKTGII